METTEQPTAIAIVQIKAEDYGLQATEAKQVEAAFIPMLNKMAELEDQYNAITTTEVMTPKVCEAAKELRLKYVKVRTGTAEIHKKAKAYYLAGGRFVDGWKNAQAFASQGKEEKLIEIEKHFERIEEERIRQIEENRKELLKPYTYAVPDALGWMTDDTFEIYLQGAKQQYEKRIEQERLEAIERERIEKERAEEQQRIEEENKRLRAEAEQRDREYRERLAEEKKERDRLQAELKAKEEAEAKAKAEAERIEKQRLEKLAKAKEQPEKERLRAWISEMPIDPPATTDPTCRMIAADIHAKLIAFKRWAQNQISTIEG